MTRNWISYVGPVYLSIFPVTSGTKYGVTSSWTTVMNGKRGGGVAVLTPRAGIAIGVLSARLQERLIPKTDNTTYRALYTTAEGDWVFDTGEDALEF